MKSFAAVTTVAIASLVGLGAAAAEPRRVTLEEAIALATEGNFEVEVARAQIAVAEQQVEKTETYRLPRLTVRASVLLWNDKVEIPLMDGLVTIRPQVTGSVEVIAVQPITVSVLLGRLIAFEEASLAVTRAEVDKKQLEVAYQVAEAYLGALQARQLRDVAATSIAQVDASLARVKALIAGGIRDDVDRLRLEAARAGLVQQGFEAEVAAETARRGLSLLLGLPDGTELELVDVDPTPPPLGWTEADAVAAAKVRRPDVRIVEQQVVKAERAVDLARGEYIPMLNLVGAYSHSEGQGAFGAKDAAYIGLQLEWNVWDWGARRADLEAAKVGHRIARRSEAVIADAVAFDVRASWLAADAAQKSLAVAEVGLVASEEAYRLQSVRFAQGAAVTTDVLDAETEVSRARSLATIARYQYLVKWMALARAVGAMPGS